MKKKTIALNFVFCALHLTSFAQKDSLKPVQKDSLKNQGAKPPSKKSITETANWLDDATTISFGNPDKRTSCRNSFNGVRLLFEPQFGHVLQTVKNRIETKDYNGLIKFGFEMNVWKGYLSIQGMMIFPATVQMDVLSPMRIENHLQDATGRINVDYGLAFGLSFFDGIIAIGYGSLFFDKRNFVNMEGVSKNVFNYQNNFVYFAIQPISAIKSVIQSRKKL